jgi:CoA:oxalate CoA-transferase
MSLDLTIVERNSSVAGAYCGRLLGMLGANVVKVEPPEGDRMRSAHPVVKTKDGGTASALFEYLNAYKRSVQLDTTTADGHQTLRALLGSADVVIDTVDGEPDRVRDDHRAASSDNERLVYVAISGFGLTGPYSGYRSNEFIDFATGGYTFITGEASRDPLQGGGPWAGYVVGTTAALAAMAALRGARQTGKGQLVDVGAMEAIASVHQWTLTLYTHQGVVKRRAGNMHAESYNPMGPVPCKDGWVSLGVASAAQWEGFCIAIDRPELLADDRFQTGGDRVDHADELKELIEPALMELTAAELVEKCQEVHVPSSPVLHLTDVLEEQQLISRDYWVRSERIGGTAKMPERPFSIPHADAAFREAPALGEHSEEVLKGLGYASTGVQ